MIEPEDIIDNERKYICLICKRRIKTDDKVYVLHFGYVTVPEKYTSPVLFNAPTMTVKRAVFCPDCWKITAGEDWMFSE